jgi:CRISPR type III-A-associated protein Csm2
MNRRNHSWRLRRDKQSASRRDRDPVFSSEEVKAILDREPASLDDAARKIAERCKDLPRAQMRNFYGPIVRLRNELASGRSKDLGSGASKDLAVRHARELMMHKVRLVYMKARNNDAEALQQSFADLIEKAISNNRAERDKVEAICDFAEAVLAYHYSQAEERDER